MMTSTLDELIEERRVLDQRIRIEQREVDAPGWMLFLRGRLGDGGPDVVSNRYILPESIGLGAPRDLYAARHFVSLTGSSGPGMLAVLRALVALEEARIREEIEDEVSS